MWRAHASAPVINGTASSIVGILGATRRSALTASTSHIRGRENDGDRVEVFDRLVIDGETTSGGFSLVEHPMSARALAAPLHRHHREDEYSYVIEGRMGALLGDDVLEAGPGDLVFKPRDQWHTFWNAGDDPCRILEIIAPAGFERFFAELVELGGVAHAAMEVLGALCERYELEMDLECPGLIERFPRIREPRQERRSS